MKQTLQHNINNINPGGARGLQAALQGTVVRAQPYKHHGHGGLADRLGAYLPQETALTSRVQALLLPRVSHSSCRVGLPLAVEETRCMSRKSKKPV